MVCFLYSIYETHHDILNSSLAIELVQNGKFHTMAIDILTCYLITLWARNSSPTLAFWSSRTFLHTGSIHAAMWLASCIKGNSMVSELLGYNPMLQNDHLKEEHLYKRSKNKSSHKKSGVKTRYFKIVSFTYSIKKTIMISPTVH
jgi:hypothetical protein